MVNIRSDSSVCQIFIWGEDIIGCIGEKKFVLSVFIFNDTSILRLNHLLGEEKQVRKVIARNISQELTLFEQTIMNAQRDDSIHFLRFSRADYWRMYPVCENQWRLISDFIEGLE